MNEQLSSPKTSDDEIDLGVVFKAIKNFFLNLLKAVFNVFRFYYRHKFILLGLLVLGIILGYLYEQNTDKKYTNNLLVTTNFDSSDYLYSKLETFDSKLIQEDTIFLKQVFGQNYSFVKSVEISPVVDIYNFVSRNESNQELFQLLFEEEGNIEFIENPINSRNFKYHRIHLEVVGENHHEDLSDALIEYVNKNAYFNDLKNVSIENIETQIKENKSIIAQIDSIVVNSSKGTSFDTASSGLTFNDNQGLRDLLQQKEILIDQEVYLQNQLINQTEIIKLVDANFKVLDTEDLFRKDKKKLFPVIFILIYSLIFFVHYLSIKAKSLTS